MIFSVSQTALWAGRNGRFPCGVPSPPPDLRAEQLAQAVRSHVQGRMSPLIGIDGGLGSGKSFLSRALVEQLGGLTLKLDCYTHGNPYCEKLRNDDIIHGLTKLREQGEPVIVDGICLLDVMDKIGVKPRRSRLREEDEPIGRWPDEGTCNPERINLDSPISSIPEQALRERSPRTTVPAIPSARQTSCS